VYSEGIIAFSEDKMIKIMECLDTTDQSVFRRRNVDSCFAEPKMYCKEQMDRLGSKIFACGDGQCVQDYEECKNGRHVLLMEAVNSQGNLSSHCWILLICLSKVNEKMCAELFQLESSRFFINSCDDVTQFPTIPVLYGHILFLYRKKNLLIFDRRFVLSPDYVCYNEHLCDFLQPSSRHGISLCQTCDQLGLGIERNYTSWASMVNSLKKYFRPCLTSETNRTDVSKKDLYCYRNSSKCVPKHRIIDGISDCYLNDDEEAFELSASLNDSSRFQCFGI
jgi:hypothetical protein